MRAADYAQALYDVGERASIARVREALERRGHIKLLPRIYAEYQKLILRDRRAKLRERSDPAHERTRILLELYKKLLASR
ncbi:MAG: hypothetical protein AAB964_01910 [Patescibacteria group bacterium]